MKMPHGNAATHSTASASTRSPRELIARLAQFNAKERYWLVRQALGGFSPDPAFLKTVIDVAGVAKVPPVSDVYMAMDYHLNWIHAALSGREFPDKEDWENPGGHQDPIRPRRAIEGNQEDVDLLLAYPATNEDGHEFTQLVFVEAKCGGAFTDKQLKSKFDRLALILGQRESGAIPWRFDARIVLMSPTKPDDELVEKMIRRYPSVLRHGLPWVPLMIEPPEDEGFWMVRPSRAPGSPGGLSKATATDWTHWSLSRRPNTRRNVPDPDR